MSRRHDNLFDQIASFQALHAAARRAARSKRNKAGVASFLARLEPECLRLERELKEGRYRCGCYTEIVVRDPKRRVVSAAPFRDRVVHHALVAAIGPLFERGFIHHSYANRVAKGTHRAVVQYERWRNQHAFVLRADVWRYFPAIDHEVLKCDLRRRLQCARTLALCDLLIDGSNQQEAVNIYFPGDDLFSPFERRRGLPLGNLTSQFFANVYLDPMDHWVTEVLRAPYLRYVDDFALFADDEETLRQWQGRLVQWLEGRRLRLHPNKTGIHPVQESVPFLGFELTPGCRRLVPANVARFRKRLDELRIAWSVGVVDTATVRQRIGAWLAHAQFAHTAGLRHALLRDGWFDPFWSDGSPVTMCEP